LSFFQSIFLGSPDLTLYGFLIRSIITYLFLLAMARLMGPSEMGEMTTIDFIAAVTIGSIASNALVESEVHFLSSLMNIALWSSLTILLNIGGCYFPGIRRIVVGRPIVLIRNGKVQEKNLFKAKMNFDDLLSSLRLAGAPLLDEIEYAILEPKGEVSVVKKGQKSAVTPEDLKIKAEYQGIPNILVLNGKISKDNLNKLGHSEEWLKLKLKSAGVDNYRNVAIAQLDSNGNLYIDLYDDTKERPVEHTKAAFIANLQKIASDLTLYSQQSEAQQAKNLYTKYAQQLEEMLKELRPLLLKTEELNKKDLGDR
jgi:uncharacterized membrane protein YcaP (DUF421 family)